MNDLIETSKAVVVICKTTTVSGITISICTLVPFYIEISFFCMAKNMYSITHIVCCYLFSCLS